MAALPFDYYSPMYRGRGYATKPPKSAVAKEAEEGNIIDAEFEEVEPEKSPPKLISKGS
jgi:hypothetical protein